jgi:Autotransporter beta-domain
LLPAVGLNGFTETGSLAPLRFGDQSVDSIRSAFGIKASYDWKIGGVLIRPELRASWQHEYGDSTYSIVASFANGAGTNFTVNGPDIGRDSLLIGAGVAILWNDRLSTYIYYDGELARTNYDSQSVSAGLRITFWLARMNFHSGSGSPCKNEKVLRRSKIFIAPADESLRKLRRSGIYRAGRRGMSRVTSPTGPEWHCLSTGASHLGSQLGGNDSVPTHFPLLRRSYEACSNLIVDSYKDFPPTEDDSAEAKRRNFREELAPVLVLTASILLAVVWSPFLSAGDTIQAAEKSILAPKQHLDIRVQANAFGSASPGDIEAVLRSAGAELLRYCPHTQLAGIDVYYRPDHPEINSKRTPGGRIAMVLSARNTHWAQYSFQFAHEFCHALANYTNSSRQTIPNTSNANLWLEESLCETASLFCLRAMSRTWQVSPPYPAFRAYAPWLADYAQQRLALPEHRLPAGTSFANWFLRHQPALRTDANQRDWNAIIAAQLLPIFEAEPAGWETVTFLNRGSSNEQESLTEHFAQWRANCPDHLRPFVSKLATVFGVRFRPPGHSPIRPFAVSPRRPIASTLPLPASVAPQCAAAFALYSARLVRDN